MADENTGIPSETSENQDENKENTRKEIPKESKLASLAKRSRTFNTKKEKDKVDPIVKFQEGVFFKAKIIGVEDVPDARGDRMCQVSLQRLKAVVRNSGEHKTKVTVCVSIEGLKIREEKTADLLYHHPVHRISFIAQDTTDNRAFGYIFGAPDMGHKFYALKTEKTASLLVIAMRDLFQVVYDMKKQEIEMAKEHRRTLNEQELLATLPQGESSPDSPEAQTIQVDSSTEVVNDLLDLESELDNLRKGISQIDTSISAAEIKKSQEELDKLVANPFGDSFVAPPPAATQAQVDFQTPKPAPAGGTSPVPATLMPPPPSKKAPHKTSEEMTAFFDAPITPNPELQTAFNPFSAPAAFPPNTANQPFGNSAPANQPFGNSAPTNQPFGSPAPANSPFGNSAPTNQPFGSPAPANSPFGNPAPANSPFGNPAPTSQAPTNSPFGNPAPINQAPTNSPFGNPVSANQAPTNSPFGNPVPTNQAPTNSPFGNPVPTNQAPTNSPFGNPVPTNQAPTNSPFGNPVPVNSTATNSPFGNPAPAEPASTTFDTPQFDAFTSDSSFDGTILSPERTASIDESKPVEQGPVDVLAALDPLGNNRPFVNKKQFFKELKPQKKSLKDLNPGAGNYINQ